MDYGLSKEVIQKICAVFESYSDIDEAIIFGSRAKGNYKTGSDIDITLQGSSLTLEKIYEIKRSLDDLAVPYEFDLSLFDLITSSELIGHIKRLGISFYSKRRQEEVKTPYGLKHHETQSEQILEDNLVKQLGTLGYDKVSIRDERELLANLKAQLEIHNEITLSDDEFKKILTHLGKGDVFEKAKILRDKMHLRRDDGSSAYLEFIDMNEWCKNQYQVTTQITQTGKYENRYDVTLLINGLPLVQIELKRRGVEIKEAFNQINRYQKHSFQAGVGLFNYVQIFVISNGVNTKYYANNKRQSFKQTFFWADVNNKAITQLDQFAKEFLEKCHLSKMITKYITLNETDKILMVLRPYQYYAVEAIVEKVKNGRSNGYVWHTTGSGKTLTSFKASQILINIPKVYKVVFVVDRRDLDYQTNKEFNAFSKGCVDGTNNTKALVEQFADPSKKLIVTTIQKLNTAIGKDRYKDKMDYLKDKRIIFIFDECHRSQFGDTHNRITKFFKRHQMFGFTGTPIFKENASTNDRGKRTTKMLFGECLHKYVITDAIGDENVLKFSIEYVGKYVQKENSANFLDIQVESIDKKEAWESDKRINDITDYIIKIHNSKTDNRNFTAMFCLGSKEMLFKYYDAFKKRKEEGIHDLKIATIFSFNANEEAKDADGGIADDSLNIDEKHIDEHSRDILERYIADYNQMFNSNHSAKDSLSYYNYYNNISKMVKERKIDILLVVNMFLTGFDSKTLNTLYVDKNLKYHGLLQAFSRTNRILNERKSQGNIICFRNLKPATDEAIALFSNLDAKDAIIMAPYHDYIDNFDEAYKELLKITPTVSSVNDLKTEEDELRFIRAFRALMRIRNILKSFADFKFSDLEMMPQEFEDYKSKYLDLQDKVKRDRQGDKTSILDEVDFELELIQRDEINVTYILTLLKDITGDNDKENTVAHKKILDIISGDIKLRNKRELIEKFITENMPKISNKDTVEDEYERFLNIEKKAALIKFCKEEGLKIDKLQSLIDSFNFSGHRIINDDVVSVMSEKPTILKRKKIAKRIIYKLMDYIDIFEN